MLKWWLCMLILSGCASVPTTAYVVPETGFILTDDPALIQRVCPHATNPIGCFTSAPRIVYCMRAEPSICVHEWLHAAGLDHEQIKKEGF